MPVRKRLAAFLAGAADGKFMAVVLIRSIGLKIVLVPMLVR